MCIAVFIWRSHPLYPFLLLLNRDEYHNRPTKPLGWWDDGEILGGRDELAGGTWLACSRDGKLVFLTNVREIQTNPLLKSRGDLPVRYLKSKKSPKEFAEELVGEPDMYGGFNLILTDLCSKSMVYITNRPKNHGLSIAEVSPGIHVLSNAKLDTLWPKAQRLLYSFEDAVHKCGDSEISIEEMGEKLMNDTTKDDESKLPHIYPPEFEYHLSAIFVEVDTPLGRYGTRSTSAVAVKTSGEVCFYEKYLDEDTWKSNTISYHVEKQRHLPLEIHGNT
ncbi:transport and Golgi organization 2 [Dorcoceras hygrometricum]|nr:transport and Golgi organization 2 [Dorcoceras hygrometricum]